MKRLAIPVTLVVLLAIAAVWLWQAPVADVVPGQVSGDAATEVVESGAGVGGPFNLTDSKGQARTDAEFRGKYMLVFFGFSHCPDVCPTGLLTMSRVLEALGKQADQIAPLFISVDPERDTPEELSRLGQNFDSRLILLTGTQEQVKEAASSYKVFYSKVPMSGGDYMMNHSGFIYLMDRDGKYLQHFEYKTPPEAVTEALNRRLAQDMQQPAE